MHLNARYFPYKKGIDFSRLRLHEVGAFSISRPDHADLITKVVCSFLEAILGLQANECSICDGTACVGGNTLSFANSFRRVRSIELDRDTFEMLQHNLKVYKISVTKAVTICGDLTQLLPKLNEDVLFIDPPWQTGEGWYTEKTRIMLFLTGQPIWKVVTDSLESFVLVVIKVPFNFDIRTFMRKLSGYVVAPHQVHNFYILMCCKVVRTNITR